MNTKYMHLTLVSGFASEREAKLRQTLSSKRKKKTII